MAMRKYLALVMMVACVASSGCYGCLGNRVSCGSGGCDSFCDASSGCPSCGCPEEACGCPEEACGCPEEACGCPAEVGCAFPEEAGCEVPYEADCGVGCGSSVRGSCPLITRLRNAFSGCSTLGCSSETYWSEWHNDSPCKCGSCNKYGSNSGGGPSYAKTPRRRSSQLAKRGANIQKELRFADEGESVYR